MTREEAIKKIMEANPSTSTFYADVIVGALHTLGLVPLDGQYQSVDDLRMYNRIEPLQGAELVEGQLYTNDDIYYKGDIVFGNGVSIPLPRIKLALEAIGYKVVKSGAKS